MALEISLEYRRRGVNFEKKGKRNDYSKRFHFNVNDWMKGWIEKLQAFHLGVST